MFVCVQVHGRQCMSNCMYICVEAKVSSSVAVQLVFRDKELIDLPSLAG